MRPIEKLFGVYSLGFGVAVRAYNSLFYTFIFPVILYLALVLLPAFVVSLPYTSGTILSNDAASKATALIFSAVQRAANVLLARKKKQPNCRVAFFQ
jgi:hypothetical protein